MARFRPLVVLPLVALLAGCVDGVTLGAPDFAHQYRPTEMGHIGAERDLRVEMYNNPYPDVDRRDVEAAIQATMRRAPTVQPLQFSFTPDENALPNYRVVLLFDAYRPVAGRDLCDDAIRAKYTPEPVEGRIRMSAAFCQSEIPLTQISGRVSEPNGYDGERFQSLIMEVTKQLFPLRNPKLEEGRCPDFMLFCP